MKQGNMPLYSDAEPARQLIGVRDVTAASSPPPPLLLSVAAVAALLSISPRGVRRLADSGKIPRPVKLGGRTLWQAEVIERWVEMGCPSAAEFGVRQGIELH